MMSTYCMRVEENMREDNNNVDMWYSDGVGGREEKKGSHFMEDCEAL